MSEDLVFVLTKPIEANGRDVTEIRFREPTGGDILAVGLPVILDMASDPPRIEHDAQKMGQMIARLGNVPPSAQAKMSPKDWTGIAWMLTPFFVPRAGLI